MTRIVIAASNVISRNESFPLPEIPITIPAAGSSSISSYLDHLIVDGFDQFWPIPG
jgi:hypothetical protein